MDVDAPVSAVKPVVAGADARDEDGVEDAAAPNDEN